MNSIDYQDFLNELISTLEADPLVWVLIALGSRSFEKSSMIDQLDTRRRLEQREPELGQELRGIGGLTVPQAGVALIELAQRKLMATTPELAWGKAAAVKEWLQGAG